MDKDSNINILNKRTAKGLSYIAIFGLIFGFALAPFYDVMCKKLGINGRADSTATALSSTQKVDKTRWVTVIFTGTTMPGIEWSFHPTQVSMRVHPGQIETTSYYAKNNATKAITGVAVPSITPELAALYFKKVECFCFKQQGLAPNESKEMPLRFYVSADLPKDVTTVTLSYSFYNSEQEKIAAKL
jgi:cytochrome c oxidase assembly protein subunit 11